MLKVRVIPVMTFNGFALVKTKQFANPRMVGNPTQAARIYNSRGVDELIFTDILATKQHRKINLAVVKQVLNECFMPVTVGGGISTIDDIRDLLNIGADKVVIKTSAILNPAIITEGAKRFGSQCMVVSVDVTKNTENELQIHAPGIENVPPLKSFIETIQNAGAGEIFINHIDNDGMMQGMDADVFNEIKNLTKLPTIICGGAGNPSHLSSAFSKVKASAVAAASIFHFTQFTPYDVKFALKSEGFPVRIFDDYKTSSVNL